MPPYKRKAAPASPVSDSTPPVHPNKKLQSMASDGSDEDIFDDDEEASDMYYDDGDSSIDEGLTPKL